jgi:hypothetical protein
MSIQQYEVKPIESATHFDKFEIVSRIYSSGVSS